MTIAHNALLASPLTRSPVPGTIYCTGLADEPAKHRPRLLIPVIAVKLKSYSFLMFGCPHCDDEYLPRYWQVTKYRRHSSDMGFLGEHTYSRLQSAPESTRVEK